MFLEHEHKELKKTSQLFQNKCNGALHQTYQNFTLVVYQQFLSMYCNLVVRSCHQRRFMLAASLQKKPGAHFTLGFRSLWLKSANQIPSDQKFTRHDSFSSWASVYHYINIMKPLVERSFGHPNINKLVVSTVPADDLAPLGAGTSAGTVMRKSDTHICSWMKVLRHLQAQLQLL